VILVHRGALSTNFFLEACFCFRAFAWSKCPVGWLSPVPRPGLPGLCRGVCPAEGAFMDRALPTRKGKVSDEVRFHETCEIQQKMD